MKGFTLIELLVVLVIIGILSTISFQGFQNQRVRIEGDQALNKIAQDIERTARMSLMGEPYGGCPGGMKIQGYGVYVSRDIDNCYFIYAECNNVTTFDNSDATCDSPGSGPDQIVETIPYGKGVSILSVRTYSIAVTSSNQLSDANILFTPPKPTVSIAGSTHPDVQVKVSLWVGGKKGVRAIWVNQRGIVKFE